MFIGEIWLFDWFCKYDLPKYGYLEVFQRALRLRDNESRLYFILNLLLRFWKKGKKMSCLNCITEFRDNSLRDFHILFHLKGLSCFEKSSFDKTAYAVNWPAHFVPFRVVYYPDGDPVGKPRMIP